MLDMLLEKKDSNNKIWYLKYQYVGKKCRVEWVHCPAAATVHSQFVWDKMVRKIRHSLSAAGKEKLVGVRTVKKDDAYALWHEKPAQKGPAIATLC
jgi:hypothetical protein